MQTFLFFSKGPAGPKGRPGPEGYIGRRVSTILNCFYVSCCLKATKTHLLPIVLLKHSMEVTTTIIARPHGQVIEYNPRFAFSLLLFFLLSSIRGSPQSNKPLEGLLLS